MKRILAGILALGAMLALGGCGEKAPEQMAREEYLPYVNGEAWDYVAEELENGEMHPDWYFYEKKHDLLERIGDDWETMRGFRNGKDSIEELKILYGDERGRIFDETCDISQNDITLNEWWETHPSHWEHDICIEYRTSFDQADMFGSYYLDFWYRPDDKKQIDVYLSAIFLEKKES